MILHVSSLYRNVNPFNIIRLRNLYFSVSSSGVYLFQMLATMITTFTLTVPVAWKS